MPTHYRETTRRERAILWVAIADALIILALMAVVIE